MSKPDLVPKQSVAGIAVDPKTLDRVIPESKRPDGSVRKQLKVRPGFTPQEDVSRFRGSRQQQLDRNQLPKGHILGWIAPSVDKKPGAAAVGAEGEKQQLSKSAAKNAKRKAKKQAEKEKVIRESWEDSDEEKATNTDGSKNQTPDETAAAPPEKRKSATSDGTTAAASSEADALADELDKKLDVH